MTASPSSDERLMRQVALGDRDCLETLIRRHADGLLTFIERMVSHRARAEELFQEVFLTVWTKSHQYEYPRRFKPWLYKIALNRCRAVFRVPVLVATPLYDEELATAEPSPEDTAIATETAKLVTTSLARLPQQQRQVVVLRIWNGMAYREIAQVIGCSEGTVRSNMHHGLNSMRRYLEPRLKE